VASLARVLPGHNIDYYLGAVPYAQGLQLQSVDLARQGVKFEGITAPGEDFASVAGV
tara:strand:+ start:381 stop:551 length:171 start_codon:yes stop_codon:yes gene_type:complete